MQLKELIAKNASLAKFIIVGGISSVVHGIISWILYYHVLHGMTVMATLLGYGGGWFCSYVGNRLWSFKEAAGCTSIKSSVFRFIVSQLVAACILLGMTWGSQQILILYFDWYILTNHVSTTPALLNFCRGASYPPALLCGMAVAAVCSYMMTRFFVFKNGACRKILNRFSFAK